MQVGPISRLILSLEWWPPPSLQPGVQQVKPGVSLAFRGAKPHPQGDQREFAARGGEEEERGQGAWLQHPHQWRE